MGAFWERSESVWEVMVFGGALGLFWERLEACWEYFGSVWRRLGTFESALECLEAVLKRLNRFSAFWERMGAFGWLGRLGCWLGWMRGMRKFSHARRSEEVGGLKLV